MKSFGSFKTSQRNPPSLLDDSGFDWRSIVAATDRRPQDHPWVAVQWGYKGFAPNRKFTEATQCLHDRCDTHSAEPREAVKNFNRFSFVWLNYIALSWHRPKPRRLNEDYVRLIGVGRCFWVYLCKSSRRQHFFTTWPATDNASPEPVDPISQLARLEWRCQFPCNRGSVLHALRLNCFSAVVCVAVVGCFFIFLFGAQVCDPVDRFRHLAVPKVWIERCPLVLAAPVVKTTTPRRWLLVVLLP